jgi:hypothetical protein
MPPPPPLLLLSPSTARGRVSFIAAECEMTSGDD